LSHVHVDTPTSEVGVLLGIEYIFAGLIFVFGVGGVGGGLVT